MIELTEIGNLSAGDIYWDDADKCWMTSINDHESSPTEGLIVFFAVAYPRASNGPVRRIAVNPTDMVLTLAKGG